MPTYQYACTECGDQLEVVQKFSDEPLTVCPACEGRLRKVFSPVGVVFKGSGFYKTDSRKSSTASSSTKSDAKSDAASDSKSDAKSDSGSGSGTKSDTTSDSSSATKQTKAASSSGGDGSKVA